MHTAKRSLEMTMNLYRRNNARPPARLSACSTQAGSARAGKLLVVASALIIVLIAADAVTGGSVRALTRTIGGSAHSLGKSAGDSIFSSGMFRTRRSLSVDNAALKERIAILEEQAAAFGALSSENASLRDLLNVPQTSLASSGITAPVISSFRASPYGTFHVGAGSADGVVEGSLVLSAENFVIGRVSEASARSAVVSAVFAPDSEIDAVVRGIGITLDGRGGGNARGRIPRQTTVAPGDIVTAPSFGGRAVGTVGSVEEDAGGSYTDVFIRLPVNLSSLRYVYIVQPHM